MKGTIMAILGIFIGLVLLVAGVVLLGVFAIPILWVLLFILGLLFGVLSTVFWIWMLVHSIRNENIGGNEKIAWVVAIALTHFLGALIYFFAGRTRRAGAIAV
jgi:hypothetical protein